MENILRPVIPPDGMWLYNESQRVISDLVYLGVEADSSEWVEITDERKQELEALWHEDATSSDADTVTEEDCQNALLDFGVAS